MHGQAHAEARVTCLSPKGRWKLLQLQRRMLLELARLPVRALNGDLVPHYLRQEAANKRPYLGEHPRGVDEGRRLRATSEGTPYVNERDEVDSRRHHSHPHLGALRKVQFSESQQLLDGRDQGEKAAASGASRVRGPALHFTPRTLSPQ